MSVPPPAQAEPMTCEHPIASLAARELPRPARPEDVEAEFDSWLTGCLPRGWDRMEALHYEDSLAPLLGPPLDYRERQLARLLRLLIEPVTAWRGISSCGAFEKEVGELERQWRPSPVVAAHLRAKAAAFAEAECGRRSGDADALHAFLEGTELRADEGMAQLPFGAGLPLRTLVRAAADDGLRLHAFRTLFGTELDAFDVEIARCRAEVEPGLLRGLERLFAHPDGGPGLAQYLADFGSLLPGAASIDVILAGLRHRCGLDDGNLSRPRLDDWMGALARLDGWSTRHLRALIGLHGCLERAPDPTSTATLCGAEALATTAGGVAVFAALHVLHAARRLRESGRTLADADRQAHLRGRIGAWPRGGRIVALADRLADLPSGIHGGDCLWDWLGDGTKRQWCLEVREGVEGDRALVKGLAEFLLSSAEKDAYHDVEPLLAELLPDAEGAAFVDEMTLSEDHLTYLRARAFRQSMLRRGPARPLSDGDLLATG